MSFKSWSSAQSAAGKEKPDRKPKAVPAASAAAGAQPAETTAKSVRAAKLAAAKPGDQMAKASLTKKS